MSHVTQLPLTRVKNVIKSDPDITLASQEAVILIAKVIRVAHHFALSTLPSVFGRTVVEAQE